MNIKGQKLLITGAPSGIGAATARYAAQKDATIIFCLFLILIIPAISWGWQGMVIGASDGDTITVVHNGKAVKIGLYGIDTPEESQSFGKTAKQFTSVMLYGKTVEVETKGIDPYDRFVALVNVGGKSLNEALIKNGYAWVYRKYCIEAFCKDWLKLENVAKYGKIGLWSEPNPILPWEFRYSKTKK
jgi:micrococcal nuclease